MLDGNVTAEMFKDIVAGIPLRRAGRAVDIAGACLFLASDLAAYVTGATIDVDDDGTVIVASADAESAKACMRRVEALTETVKIGKIYSIDKKTNPFFRFNSRADYLLWKKAQANA